MTYVETHFEVGNTFSDLLDFSGAFKPKDEGGLGRRVNGALTDDKVLEVKTAVTREIILLILYF